METRFQFLKKLYYPGYMGLQTENYDGRTGVFDFTPTEPKVFIPLEYFTPRGLIYLFLKQGSV